MLWDLNEGKHLYTLDAGDIINSMCFSPNRYWLCAACGPQVKIWVGTAFSRLKQDLHVGCSIRFSYYYNPISPNSEIYFSLLCASKFELYFQCKKSNSSLFTFLLCKITRCYHTDRVDCSRPLLSGLPVLYEELSTLMLICKYCAVNSCSLPLLYPVMLFGTLGSIMNHIVTDFLLVDC